MLMRNPASGMGLTGSTSNRDLTFLKGSVAGLSKTPEGNKLILKGLLKVYEMQKRVMAEQSRLIKENNGVPPLNLESKLESFVIEQDVFGEDLRNQMIRLQEAGKGGAGGSTTNNTVTGGSSDKVYNYSTKQFE